MATKLGPDAGSDEYLRRNGWRYQARFYYASDVKPPKTPRALAIETVHKDYQSLQWEIEAGKSRPDIGVIDWRAL